MESRELRDIYDAMLETGEIFELLPNASGKWNEDKVEFKDIQEALVLSVEDPDNPSLSFFSIHEKKKLMELVDIEDEEVLDEEDNEFC